MDQTEVLLRDISNANGVSGHEGAAREVMAGYMKGLADISYDKLGSLIGRKKGTADSPRVLVAGHLDEIGFMVKEITSEGYIKFLSLGGWWGHVALAQRVRIMTSKGPVIGVIGSTPPHLLKPKDREKVLEIEDMFIDVGAMEKYDVTKKLGVKVGDPIIPDSQFTIMNNDQMYLAKALDNRVACAMVIEILRHFKKAAHPNTIFGVGTVQEEVGIRGAKTVAHAVDPDVAVILDVTVARDIPPDGYKVSEKLGAGAAILVYDGGMIPNQRLRQLLMKTAEENKIPYHLTSLLRGTTDGAAVHVTRSGVPTVFLGIETRYIHSHNSIIYRKDYDNIVKLAVAVIKKLNKKTVDSLTAA
ncbi:MAG: M42 family metallopeptidase [Candidatus Zixiibacteriota bacterium]